MSYHIKPQYEAVPESDKLFGQIFDNYINDKIQKAVKKALTDGLTQQVKQSQSDPSMHVSIDWICQNYGISKTTVHFHMKKGLKFKKIGRSTRFLRTDVEKYFEGKS